MQRAIERGFIIKRYTDGENRVAGKAFLHSDFRTAPEQTCRHIVFDFDPWDSSDTPESATSARVNLAGDDISARSAWNSYLPPVRHPLSQMRSTAMEFKMTKEEAASVSPSDIDNALQLIQVQNDTIAHLT